jgi:hypothetical protein
MTGSTAGSGLNSENRVQEVARSNPSDAHSPAPSGHADDFDLAVDRPRLRAPAARRRPEVHHVIPRLLGPARPGDQMAGQQGHRGAKSEAPMNVRPHLFALVVQTTHSLLRVCT